MGATKAPKKDVSLTTCALCFFHGLQVRGMRFFFFGASCVVGLSHTDSDYSYYSVITAKFFNDVYVIIVTVTACCVRVSS